MLFMQNVFQSLKKNWKFLFGSIVVISIVIATVLNLITPASQKIVPAISNTSIPTIKQTNFQGAVITLPVELPTVPASFAVYAAVSRNVDLATLATSLNMQSSDQGVHWYSATGESLSQDPYSHRIGYSNLESATATPAANFVPVNTDQAIQAATNFITNKLQLTSLVPNTQNLTYLLSNYDSQQVSPAEADIVEIPFFYQVGNQPVYSDEDLFSPILIKVNSQNQVLNFTMSPTLFTPSTQRTNVQSLPIEQIKNRLLTNNVGVIQIGSQSSDGFTIQDIQSLTISQIKIEYRLNSQSNQVMPYYRLSASAINLNGTTTLLELITPAIQTVAK